MTDNNSTPNYWPNGHYNRPYSNQKWKPTTVHPPRTAEDRDKCATETMRSRIKHQEHAEKAKVSQADERPVDDNLSIHDLLATGEGVRFNLYHNSTNVFLYRFDGFALWRHEGFVEINVGGQFIESDDWRIVTMEEGGREIIKMLAEEMDQRRGDFADHVLGKIAFLAMVGRSYDSMTNLFNSLDEKNRAVVGVGLTPHGGLRRIMSTESHEDEIHIEIMHLLGRAYHPVCVENLPEGVDRVFINAKGEVMWEDNLGAMHHIED